MGNLRTFPMYLANPKFVIAKLKLNVNYKIISFKVYELRKIYLPNLCSSNGPNFWTT